jgi:fructosamine-3-kinase
MKAWQSIIEQIEQVTKQHFTLVKAHPMHGGDINSVYRLEGVEQNYFIKINRVDLLNMFAAEALALQELAQIQALRIPKPVMQGTAGDNAFLVLEYIELKSLTPASAQQLGRQLAHIHQQPQPYFGWHHDNYIGSTPQKNTRANDWSTFWQQQRLAMQLALAAENGFRGKIQEKGMYLGELLPAFFSAYQPQASLLHGDLWAGNAAADAEGNAVIYDPASYYGDREADIAMTELFGGFGETFYDAYTEVWPLDTGYKTRKVLYNLYHILNHLNLFGGGYLHQAEAMIQQLVAEIE